MSLALKRSQFQMNHFFNRATMTLQTIGATVTYSSSNQLEATIVGRCCWIYLDPLYVG
jgi:hypothetical protein